MSHPCIISRIRNRIKVDMYRRKLGKGEKFYFSKKKRANFILELKVDHDQSISRKKEVGEVDIKRKVREST